MRNLLLALLAALLSASAFADNFQDGVDEALAKGNPAAVIKELESEAFRGNLKAAHQLGLFYREGKNVPKNFEKAFEWLESAADSDWIRFRFKLGLDEAQYELGVMMRDGIGRRADAGDAAAWFERAANQGHSLAQSALAELYLKGSGVSRDAAKAYFWASMPVEWLEGEQRKRVEATRNTAQALLTPQQKAEQDKIISEWYPRSI